MQWMRICKKVVASLTLVFFIQTHVLLPAVYAAAPVSIPPDAFSLPVSSPAYLPPSPSFLGISSEGNSESTESVSSTHESSGHYPSSVASEQDDAHAYAEGAALFTSAVQGSFETLPETLPANGLCLIFKGQTSQFITTDALGKQTLLEGAAHQDQQNAYVCQTDLHKVTIEKGSDGRLLMTQLSSADPVYIFMEQDVEIAKSVTITTPLCLVSRGSIINHARLENASSAFVAGKTFQNTGCVHTSVLSIESPHGTNTGFIGSKARYSDGTAASDLQMFFKGNKLENLQEMHLGAGSLLSSEGHPASFINKGQFSSSRPFSVKRLHNEGVVNMKRAALTATHVRNKGHIDAQSLDTKTMVNDGVINAPTLMADRLENKDQLSTDHITVRDLINQGKVWITHGKVSRLTNTGEVFMKDTVAIESLINGAGGLVNAINLQITDLDNKGDIDCAAHLLISGKFQNDGTIRFGTDQTPGLLTYGATDVSVGAPTGSFTNNGHMIWNGLLKIGAADITFAQDSVLQGHNVTLVADRIALFGTVTVNGAWDISISQRLQHRHDPFLQATQVRLHHRFTAPVSKTCRTILPDAASEQRTNNSWKTTGSWRTKGKLTYRFEQADTITDHHIEGDISADAGFFYHGPSVRLKNEAATLSKILSHAGPIEIIAHHVHNANGVISGMTGLKIQAPDGIINGEKSVKRSTSEKYDPSQRLYFDYHDIGKSTLQSYGLMALRTDNSSIINLYAHILAHGGLEVFAPRSFSNLSSQVFSGRNTTIETPLFENIPASETTINTGYPKPSFSIHFNFNPPSAADYNVNHYHQCIDTSAADFLAGTFTFIGGKINNRASHIYTNSEKPLDYDGSSISMLTKGYHPDYGHSCRAHATALSYFGATKQLQISSEDLLIAGSIVAPVIHITGDLVRVGVFANRAIAARRSFQPIRAIHKDIVPSGFFEETWEGGFVRNPLLGSLTINLGEVLVHSVRGFRKSRIGDIFYHHPIEILQAIPHMLVQQRGAPFVKEGESPLAFVLRGRAICASFYNFLEQKFPEFIDRSQDMEMIGDMPSLGSEDLIIQSHSAQQVLGQLMKAMSSHGIDDPVNFAVPVDYKGQIVLQDMWLLPPQHEDEGLLSCVPKVFGTNILEIAARELRSEGMLHGGNRNHLQADTVRIERPVLRMESRSGNDYTLDITPQAGGQLSAGATGGVLIVEGLTQPNCDLDTVGATLSGYSSSFKANRRDRPVEEVHIAHRARSFQGIFSSSKTTTHHESHQPHRTRYDFTHSIEEEGDRLDYTGTQMRAGDYIRLISTYGTRLGAAIATEQSSVQEKTGGITTGLYARDAGAQTHHPVSLSAPRILTLVRHGDFETVAPILKGDVTMETPGGTQHHRAVYNTSYESVTDASSDAFWVSMTQEGHQSRTVQDLQHSGGTLRLIGPHVTAEVRSDRPFDTFMQALQENGHAETRHLEDQFNAWHAHSEAVGPGLSVLITIAVSAATMSPGGMFATLGESAAVGIGATGAGVSFVSGAVNAMLLDMTSHLAVSTISAGGDIGKALEQTFSGEHLKSVGINMLAAGCANALCHTLEIGPSGSKIEGVTSGKAAAKTGIPLSAQKVSDAAQTAAKWTVGDRLQKAAVDIAVKVPLHATLGNADGAALRGVAMASAAQFAGSAAAAEIGDLAHNKQVNAFTQKLMHAFAGAGTAKLIGADAASGAVGAVIGEMVGETYRKAEETADMDPEAFARLRHRGDHLAQMTAATLAIITGQDPTIAAMTAGNAARENALNPFAVMKSAHKVLTAFNAEEKEQALTDCAKVLKEEFGITALPSEIENTLTSLDAVLIACSGGDGGHDTRRLYRDLGNIVTGTVNSVLDSGREGADLFEQGAMQLTNSDVIQQISRCIGGPVGLMAGCFIAASGKIPKGAAFTRFTVHSAKYMQDMERRSGLKIPQSQRDALKAHMKSGDVRTLVGEEKMAHTKPYRNPALKQRLVSEWERETGQKWPVYRKDIIASSGRVWFKKGDPVQSHHIIPQQQNGPHRWWNMHPLEAPIHHQSGVHGKGAPLRKLQAME